MTLIWCMVCECALAEGHGQFTCQHGFKLLAAALGMEFVKMHYKYCGIDAVEYWNRINIFKSHLRQALMYFEAQIRLSADCCSFRSNYLDCSLGWTGYKCILYGVCLCISVCMHICTAVFSQLWRKRGWCLCVGMLASFSLLPLSVSFLHIVARFSNWGLLLFFFC